MPQASERLRRKFMKGNDDGMKRCEALITKAGGSVNNGVIKLPEALDLSSNPDVADAITFLCQEWDYSAEVVHPEPQRTTGLTPNDCCNDLTTTLTFSSPGDPANGTCLAGYEDVDYKPLWDFILVEPVKEKKVTQGGIHLPDNAKPIDDTRRCKVIKAGPGAWVHGVFIPNPINVGQYIYNMAKHMQPYRVIIKGKLYLSMPSSEVLAVADSSGYEEEEVVTPAETEEPEGSE